MENPSVVEDLDDSFGNYLGKKQWRNPFIGTKKGLSGSSIWKGEGPVEKEKLVFRNWFGKKTGPLRGMATIVFGQSWK